VTIRKIFASIDRFTCERADEETSAVRSYSYGGVRSKGKEELEEGVGCDAGETPLERLEQGELHVLDRRRQERVAHHLFHLHAYICF